MVITSGCSGALELVIRSLAGPGDNILIPSPGFSLYQCLAAPLDVECRSYRLIVSGISMGLLVLSISIEVSLHLAWTTMGSRFERP